MDSLLYFIPYCGSFIRLGTLLVCIPIVYYMSTYISAACAKRFSRHIGVLIEHTIFYGGIILIGINVLDECGFNISTLLGAAGIIGVAVGFASQTSVSNIISGFFLLLERPFTIGDVIKCGDTTGIA
jgi:small-conductance mechanosensitive channel